VIVRSVTAIYPRPGRPGKAPTTSSNPNALPRARLVTPPINYRIYDKTENKTKNDYFQEMLAEVLGWGLEPAFVTGDSGYSSLENLKMI
jgi:hypothetical protein